MDLNQAASIIIGANIGTTVTGLLASLESLNISLYLSLLVFIGVMMSFAKKVIKIANLLSGLGMIFVGLKLMSDACNDDSIKSSFEETFKKINFPLLLELLGIVFTAIIQSSSAMTGIVIVMVSNKVMNMNNGLYITLGANIGTCVTALIGSIGANLNSKRTAVIHLTFNISGCLIFTPILWIFNGPILNLLNAIVSKEAMQIAYFHLFFNCTTALITTPLINYLVKIACFIIKDKNQDDLVENFMKDKEKLEISPEDIKEDLNVEYDPPKNISRDKEEKVNKNEIKDEENKEKEINDEEKVNGKEYSNNEEN